MTIHIVRTPNKKAIECIETMLIYMCSNKIANTNFFFFSFNRLFFLTAPNLGTDCKHERAVKLINFN